MWRTHGWLLALVVIVLFATTDDRHAGQTGDGRQMIWTAVAIAETGEIRTGARPRPRGRAWIGCGLALRNGNVAGAGAGGLDRAGRRRALRRQCVAAAVSRRAVLSCPGCRCVCDSRGARTGRDRARRTQRARGVATLGSPLAAYAAMDFSEPLQAAALAAAFVAAIRASRPGVPGGPGEVRPAYSH